MIPRPLGRLGNSFASKVPKQGLEKLIAEQQEESEISIEAKEHSLVTEQKAEQMKLF